MEVKEIIRVIPTSYRRGTNTYTRTINGHYIRILIMSSCWDIDVCYGGECDFDKEKHKYHVGGSTADSLRIHIKDAEEIAEEA